MALMSAWDRSWPSKRASPFSFRLLRVLLEGLNGLDGTADIALVSDEGIGCGEAGNRVRPSVLSPINWPGRSQGVFGHLADAIAGLQTDPHDQSIFLDGQHPL